MVTDEGSGGLAASVRAQSEVIGFVLVLGMVVAGAGAIAIYGSTALGDSQDALGVQRAEMSMTQFDSRSALVALGNTDSQQVDFPLRSNEQLGVDETAGELTIDVKSFAGGPSPTKSWELGKFVYSTQDTEIAYQGGGVWRKPTDSDSSVMVSPPEFHFRNGTLTLPVITVSGESTVGSRASVRAGTPASTWYPNEAAGRPNPLDDHRVFVNVTSEYYRGWGQYFEDRTDGEVLYDHANDKVSLELVTPIGTRTVRDAAASLAPTGSFTVSGSSSDPCSGGAGGSPSNRPYANSYNSSDTTNDYCDQHTLGLTGNDGNITYGKTIDVSTGSGGSPIEGNLRSGGAVYTGHGGGHPYVDGDIYYTTTCSQCGTQVSGNAYKISGVGTVSPIDRRVKMVTSDLSGDNDNGATGGTIASDEIVFDEGAGDPDGADTATVTAGHYHVDRIDFSGGDTLDVDTSGGEVRIAVRDYVEVGSGDEINVHGDGIARIYVAGENPTSVGGKDHMLHINGGDINVRDDDAPELRVYGKRNFNTTVNDGTFTGVLYAPPGNSGTSSLAIDHGAVFGGAVVADTEIMTQGSIHFDEALRNEQVVSPNAKVVKITFLHVSESEIEISN